MRLASNNIAKIDAETFFLWKRDRILIDLRSEKLYMQGSLEEAISIPFEKSKNFDNLISQLSSIIKNKELHIIDEDASTAKLLSQEIPIYYLKDGYEGFKLWREAVFSRKRSLYILGGNTGSSKSLLLRHLSQKGYQVIDLENIARNKGSAFGYLPGEEQPSHEEFQNLLLKQWLETDFHKPLFIEEKGPFLGKVGLPKSLYEYMSKAPMISLEVPFDQRLSYIIKEYSYLSKEDFRKAIRALESRMGMSQNHKALHYHDTGQKEKCMELLLQYYDKGYERRRQKSWQGNRIRIQHQHDSLEETIHKIASIVSD